MDDMTDLDDAIIEDTVHCQCCGCSWVLGGNDGVIVEVPQLSIPPYECGACPEQGPCPACGDQDKTPRPVVAQLTLCIECAAAVHKAYEQACRDASVCEHGVNDGDWCEDCNKEYKRAAEQYGRS